MKRRHLLLGASAVTALGAVALRPEDRGGPHSDYFQSLSKALQDAGIHTPTLVVDSQSLTHNINRLKKHLPDTMAYRVVVKSLPSLELVKRVAEQSGTGRMMVFHQPFIETIAKAMPGADLLLGKPMPVQAAAQTLDNLDALVGFDARQQLQWLVDSEARLREYAALAAERRQAMQINLEIDVGLHRGGFADDESFIKTLRLFPELPFIRLSGLMGYEPHIVKIPEALGGGDKAFAKVQSTYQRRLDQIADILPDTDLKALTLNTGGSGTFQLYDGSNSPANELAMGSGLVMPTTFDLPTLADHLPASYIAAPVLKVQQGVQVPGLEFAGDAFRWLDPNRAQSIFTYGGYWKAKPESPGGLSPNPIYGRSTNQEMLNGSAKVDLAPGDYVFLRPEQSEFVFLQFGDIAVFDGQRIVERWPVFDNTG